MANPVYQIHKAEFENLISIKDLEEECKLSNWSLADYEKELKRSDSIFLTVKKDEEVIGFLLARLIMDNYSTLKDLKSNNSFIELFNIGIKTNYRKRGIGKMLMERLISEGISNNAQHIFLEVRNSNEQAAELYRKFGFEVIYERKNLYRDPVENGLGMKLSLIKMLNLI